MKFERDILNFHGIVGHVQLILPTKLIYVIFGSKEGVGMFQKRNGS